MSVDYGPNLGKMINAATGDSFAEPFRFLLRAFDALVQCAVISKILSTPPGSPTNGDRYIVAGSPTGAWTGMAGHVVCWTTNDPAHPSGVWQDFPPKAGWLLFNVEDLQLYHWNGTAWTPATSGLLPLYTVTNLPAGAAGMVAYASDGRKQGEGAGVGTGVPCYYSAGNWRRYSDDTTVAA